MKVSVSAAKDIIKYDLMEEFHWLPWEIDRIPNKTMQKILLIRKQKNESEEHQINIDKFKQSVGTSGRRSYREV